MGFLGRAMRSGLALKAMSIAKREMSKPENQRKAKDLLRRITKRDGPSGQPSRR